MKDYSDMCIFDIMKVPTDELKELTIEEFAEEINHKGEVHIHSVTDKNYFNACGNISIDGVNVHLYISKDADGYRMHLAGRYCIDSFFNVYLSEHLLYGIYSYENGKHYRIAFEGNNPDIIISVLDRDGDKKQIIQADIRALIQKCEYDKYYEPKNIEMLTKTIEELKKLLD